MSAGIGTSVPLAQVWWVVRGFGLGQFVLWSIHDPPHGCQVHFLKFALCFSLYFSELAPT
jgi:hypothetical protein